MSYENVQKGCSTINDFIVSQPFKIKVNRWPFQYCYLKEGGYSEHFNIPSAFIKLLYIIAKSPISEIIPAMGSHLVLSYTYYLATLYNGHIVLLV